MKLPKHEHTHSLFVRCLSCYTFGTPGEGEMDDLTKASECGNCGSMYTVKYYPGCCLIKFKEGSK